MKAHRTCAAIAALMLIPALYGQNEEGTGYGLGTGELNFSIGGLRAEGNKDWITAFNIGGAYNAFKNPQLPLIFEYNGALTRTSNETSASATNIDYFGGGIRFGGSNATGGLAPYGLTSVGFAKFTSATAIQIGQNVHVSRDTFTKAAMNLGGGINIDLTPKWGIKTEVRGIKIQDLQPWLYQISAGIYYRLGK